MIGAPVAAKRQLDVMPQLLALYEDLSATENLNYWGAAYGLGGTERKQRVCETLEFVALVDRAEEPWGDSFGQVKRQGGAGRGVQITHAGALGRLLGRRRALSWYRKYSRLRLRSNEARA